MEATREAINVKAVVAEHGGQTHTQIFAWTDSNALAMQDRILAQQQLAERRRQWRCLRIDTPRLLDLLGMVLTTSPDEARRRKLKPLHPRKRRKDEER